MMTAVLGTLAALVIVPATVSAQEDAAVLCNVTDHYLRTSIIIGDLVECHDADHNNCGGGIWLDLDGDGTEVGDEAFEWHVVCKVRGA